MSRPKYPSQRRPRSVAGANRPTAILETASDYVAGELKAGILFGRYSLGSRLDQKALADQMGVSTIPVREGIRRLEAEGLVRIYPRRGAFVAELSAAEVREINRIRGPLEDLATRLAAPKLNAGHLQELADLNEHMARMTKARDATTWGNLNREWHFKLYAAAEAPLLLQLIGGLWDRSRLYRLVNASQADYRAKSVLEHREILLRLAAGDGGGAGRGMVRHIRRAEKDLLPRRISPASAMGS